MTLSIDDRLQIHELINLYAHLIDDRQFDRLGEVFTADAEFDLAGYGGRRYCGLDAIIKLMQESTEHPLAHHATNIVIDEELAGGRITVRSKGIGVGHKGRVGSVVYIDQVLKIDSVWRIVERQVFLIRSDK